MPAHDTREVQEFDVRDDGRRLGDSAGDWRPLIADVLAGVPGAPDRLLAELHPPVLRYCRRRVGYHERQGWSADDIAQDICLAVVAALSTYQLKDLSFRAFVFGIAAHKVADAYRAAGRNHSDPVADVPDAPVSDRGPAQRLIEQERAERLGALMLRLTLRQREILVYRIMVGLTAEETAARLGMTPNAVRVGQHRALARLRVEISATDSDVFGRRAADAEADDPVESPHGVTAGEVAVGRSRSLDTRKAG